MNEDEGEIRTFVFMLESSLPKADVENRGFSKLKG